MMTADKEKTEARRKMLGSLAKALTLADKPDKVLAAGARLAGKPFDWRDFSSFANSAIRSSQTQKDAALAAYLLGEFSPRTMPRSVLVMLWAMQWQSCRRLGWGTGADSSAAAARRVRPESSMK